MSGSVIDGTARFAEARARAENGLDVMLQLGICPSERPANVIHATIGDSIAECDQCQSNACDVELSPRPDGYQVTHHPRWPVDPLQD